MMLLSIGEREFGLFFCLKESHLALGTQDVDFSVSFFFASHGRGLLSNPGPGSSGNDHYA